MYYLEIHLSKTSEVNLFISSTCILSNWRKWLLFKNKSDYLIAPWKQQDLILEKITTKCTYKSKALCVLMCYILLMTCLMTYIYNICKIILIHIFLWKEVRLLVQVKVLLRTWLLHAQYCCQFRWFYQWTKTKSNSLTPINQVLLQFKSACKTRGLNYCNDSKVMGQTGLSIHHRPYQTEIAGWSHWSDVVAVWSGSAPFAILSAPFGHFPGTVKS